MTQNIKLLPEPSLFAKLFELTSNITQTTAHTRYTSQDLSNIYQTPVHHTSVFIDSSQYIYKSYKEKKNLILYSPDPHPSKERILNVLKKNSNYILREITGLAYEEYKNQIATAKFILSFGEGFDGYFLEAYLSGSIGIAVYNNTFFPNKKWLQFEPVFNSYDEMEYKLIASLEKIDRPHKYTTLSKAGLNHINKQYNFRRYISKIKAFYSHKYDYTPEYDSNKTMLRSIIANSAIVENNYKEEIRKLNKKNDYLENSLSIFKDKNGRLENDLISIYESRTWRLTRPLRILFQSRRHEK